MGAYTPPKPLIFEAKRLLFLWDLANVIKKLILLTVLCMIIIQYNSLDVVIDYYEPLSVYSNGIKLILSYQCILAFWWFVLVVPVYVLRCHLRIAKLLLLPFAKFEDWRFICWGQFRSIPSSVNILIEKYNIQQCIFCWQSLIHNKNIVLMCGHVYHQKCLKNWELHQFYTDSSKVYSCPHCRTKYDWAQKFAFRKH